MNTIVLQNLRFPLRLINFTNVYLKNGGTVLSDNKIISQLSKLEILDYFFPALLIQKLPDTSEEASYDYASCYILSPRKQGVLSNLGSYKQKINNIEDCLLGNSRDESTYKNYTVAHNMIRRAANDLFVREDVFRDTARNLRRIYENRLDESQQESLSAWMHSFLELCKSIETKTKCTADRRDGFSFDSDVYDALIERADSLLKEQKDSDCWAWLCIGSLLGNYVSPLLKKYSADFSSMRISAPSSDTYRLISSPSVITDPYFRGRDAYLKQIHDMFREGQRVIFLHGISGIGKTEIVREYASIYRNEYDTIIYAVYESSIRDLIIHDMPFETSPAVRRITVNGEPESDEAYFRRKLDIIKKASTERTLIIIDNFNTERDDDLKELIEGRYHLLFTTQYDIWHSYASIRIDEIKDMDSLIEIFMNHYQGYAVEKDDPDLIRLIQSARCHTYTVVLLAHHMENSGQTAAEMIEALRVKGILSLNEKVSMSGNSEDEAYQKLVHMFSVFRFSEEEKRVLQLLSLLPLTGIPPMVFRKWADLSSTRAIVSLERQGWILRSSQGIALHPVVRRVIQYALPVQTDSLRSFLDHAADTLANENSWHYTQAEKEQYCSIASGILSFLPGINENTVRFIQSASIIFGYSGKTEEAIRLSEQLYQYRYNTEGERSFETARAAYRVGWQYLYNSRLDNTLKNAELWMRRAYDLFQKTNLDTNQKKAMYCGVLENLASLYLKKYEMTHHSEDLDSAETYAMQGVTAARKWLTDYTKDKKSPAGNLLRLADVYMVLQKYEEAEKLINEAHTILSYMYKDDDHKDPDILRATSRKAAVLYDLGRYEESLAETEKNISAYQLFFGDDNSSCFDQLVLKYRNCLKLNKTGEAEETKKEALRLGQKLYPAGSAKLRDLIR